MALKSHSHAASIDAAQSLAANNFVDFWEPENVAFVPLIQQLLAAEECLQNRWEHLAICKVFLQGMHIKVTSVKTVSYPSHATESSTLLFTYSCPLHPRDSC